MILNLNSKLENPIMLVSQLLIQHLGDNAVDDFHSTNLKMSNPNYITPQFQVRKPNHACESLSYSTSWC